MLNAMTKQLSPYVRVAMNGWLHKNKETFDRVIWDYELLYVKQGTLEITVLDEVTEVGPGAVILFKPRQAHRIKVISDEPVNQPHVHFDLIEIGDSSDVKVSFKHENAMSDEERNWFRPDLLSGPEMNLPTIIKPTSIQPFEDLLFRIIREYELRLDYYEIRLKSMMLDLLVYLLRDTHSPFAITDHDQSDQLLEIQYYIHARANQELTLDELSCEFYRSKQHLIQLFKTAYNITPIHYHQQLRIERAKNQLKFTRHSIQEIANILGYPSIHAFSRAFKNKEGYSPSAYRNAVN